MPSRDDIIAEAFGWIGTPHHHQASAKGAGCDCKGLIWGIARGAGMPEADHPLMAHSAYSYNIDTDFLGASLAKIFKRVAAPRLGDVAVIVLAGRPQHLGLIMPDHKILHSYQRGPGCVINVPIGLSRKFDSFWTWPSLGD
jgi:cell wall-associated NlpC family hydrolase